MIDFQVAVKLVSGEVCDVLGRLELRRIDCRLSDKGNFVSLEKKITKESFQLSYPHPLDSGYVLGEPQCY